MNNDINLQSVLHFIENVNFDDIMTINESIRNRKKYLLNLRQIEIMKESIKTRSYFIHHDRIECEGYDIKTLFINLDVSTYNRDDYKNASISLRDEPSWNKYVEFDFNEFKNLEDVEYESPPEKFWQKSNWDSPFQTVVLGYIYVHTKFIPKLPPLGSIICYIDTEEQCYCMCKIQEDGIYDVDIDTNDVKDKINELNEWDNFYEYSCIIKVS